MVIEEDIVRKEVMKKLGINNDYIMRMAYSKLEIPAVNKQKKFIDRHVNV